MPNQTLQNAHTAHKNKFSQIIFGPVISRRFGRSLGIDLSPSKKQCNFDCVYCELKKAKPMDFMGDVLPKELVIESIKTALLDLARNAKSMDSSETLDSRNLRHKNLDSSLDSMALESSAIDVLTFTANGEPTLYPYLYDVISAIKPFVPKNCKTLILSNGSRFKEQKDALLLFDIVKFSLDGAIESVYKKTDRPEKNLKLEKILEGIKEFARIYRGELVAEVLLVKGFNDSKENLLAIASFLRELKVARIDLGSIDRPSAYDVKAIDSDVLESFLPYFEGLCVSLLKRSKSINITKKSYNKSELLKLISTRPIEVCEAKILFSKDTLAILENLLESKEICITNSANLRFYTKGENYYAP